MDPVFDSWNKTVAENTFNKRIIRELQEITTVTSIIPQP